MKSEPFSFAVLTRDVPSAGRRYEFSADEAQRRNLAESLGILGVEELSAVLNLEPLAQHSFRVRGQLAAKVVQTDVVTLDPVTLDVDEKIDITLAPAESSSRVKPAEVLVDVAEEDGPDLFHNGRIDLGVIASEHLALGLDPYPRAPDTDFTGYVEDDPAADPSPFAQLAALRDGKS